jgi:hypothetical protein
MGVSNHSQNGANRRPYEKPTATELTREEAKRKLSGHARRGNQDARELLGMMFPEEAKKLFIDDEERSA